MSTKKERIGGVKSILLYDNTGSDFVSKTWRAGAVLFSHMFYKVVACNSIKDFVDCSGFDIKKGDDVRVQFWGHGAPGSPLIGGKAIEIYDVSYADSIWFRCCSVAQGKEGIKFCQELADLGVDVVAHTDVIGTWGCHSGLVGVRAGRKVWWKEDDFRGASNPFLPRTIPSIKMDIPNWAWTRNPIKKTMKLF